MSSYIGKIKIDNVNYPIGSTLYGTCSGTVSGDATSYSVSLGEFDKLETGVTVHVKFTTANISNATKLKVGSTAAATITNPNGQVAWAANSVISFTYDGTNWIMNDGTTYQTLDQSTVTTGTETTGKLITAKIIKDSINNAINALDVSNITTNLATNKTITALSETDGKISATATEIAIPISQITNFPTLGTAAAKNVATSAITDNDTGTDLPTKAQVATYVANKTSGLTGAMHFIGKSTIDLSIAANSAANPTISGYDWSKKAAGDVVLNSTGNKEYVWNGTAWIELGDEGSYALNTITITGSNGLTGGGAISSNQVISHASRPATSATADETFGSSAARYYIKQIKVDSYGHIFDVVTGNETVSNTDTKLRTYRSSTAVELPIAGINTGNATAAYSAISSGSYKDVYAAIPETTANVATINPSTGIITAPGFKGTLQATDVKTALSYDSSTAATTLSFLHKSGNWKTLSISYDDASNGKVVTGFTFSGGSLPTYTQGTKASASVSNGVLTITNQGTDSFTQGSVATLTSITKTNIAISAS